MPLLAVDKVDVLGGGFLPADLPFRDREIRRVSVGGEGRGHGAFRRTNPLILDGLVEIALLLLMYRAHRLQPLDRAVVHVAVPLADPRRVHRFRPMRRLEPRLDPLLRIDVRAHWHRTAIETMLMLIEKTASHRCGNGRANRGRARIRVRDRALQDRPPRQLARLFAHRLSQSRLLRIVHVICGIIQSFGVIQWSFFIVVYKFG